MQQESNKKLNELLQKSQGDISGLTVEDRRELLRLLSDAVTEDYRNELAPIYPDKNPLIAAIIEERFKRRMTRQQFSELLGVSGPHLGNVVGGRLAIGLKMARLIHRNLGLDANFIMKYI